MRDLVKNIVGAVAVAAGGVGLAYFHDKELNREKKRSFEEGFEADSVARRESQKENLEQLALLVLSSKLGVAVAKSDGFFHPLELASISKNIWEKRNVLMNIDTERILKEATQDVDYDVNILFDEISEFLDSLSSDRAKIAYDFFSNILQEVVNADSVVSAEEAKFIEEWEKKFSSYSK